MEINRAVRQQDPYGCGIACVAFVNGISYNEAKRKYFRRRKDAGSRGYICKDLVKALKVAGKEYGYRYIKEGKRGFRNGDIIFIKRSRRYPAGHYLARTRSGWMDSWINFDANNPKIRNSKAGFRKRLPGKAIYAVFAKVI